MAERFVKTIKRDDVAFMPKPDAATTVCSATLLSRSSTTTGRLRVYIAVRAWTVLPTWSTRSLKAPCETSGTPVCRHWMTIRTACAPQREIRLPGGTLTATGRA